MLFTPRGVVTRQLLKKRALFIGEATGQLHRHRDAMVAASDWIAEFGNALSSQRQDGSGLSPWRNLESGGTIHGLNFDAVSEDRLQVADFDLRENVRPSRCNLGCGLTVRNT